MTAGQITGGMVGREIATKKLAAKQHMPSSAAVTNNKIPDAGVVHIGSDHGFILKHKGASMSNFERAIGRMNLHKATPVQDEEVNREIAASANRIDMIIAVFAFGVVLGSLIA